MTLLLLLLTIWLLPTMIFFGTVGSVALVKAGRQVTGRWHRTDAGTLHPPAGI